MTPESHLICNYNLTLNQIVPAASELYTGWFYPNSLIFLLNSSCVSVVLSQC